MFFKKKQKKLDSKVRFQHTQFTRQLNAARSFKRQSAPVPEGRFQLLLTRVGLRSWTMRIIVTIVSLLLIYLVFIPNFLYISEITVHGLAPDDASKVRDSVSKYFKNNLWPLPQKNSIFLNEQKLSTFLLGVDEKIYKIERIVTHYPNELEIVIVPRKPRYILRAKTQMLVLNNDGTVASYSPYDQAQFTEGLPQSLSRVVIDTDKEATVDQIYFPDQKLAEQLQTLRDLFMQKITTGISYFEIPTFQSTVVPILTQDTTNVESQPTATEVPLKNSLTEEPKQVNWSEIVIHTKKDPNQNTLLPQGYFVLFDRTIDIPTAIDKLAVLLGKMESGRRSNLFYVDMRLKNRGFICLRGAACSFETRDPFNAEVSKSVSTESDVAPEVNSR